MRTAMDEYGPFPWQGWVIMATLLAINIAAWSCLNAHLDQERGARMATVTLQPQSTASAVTGSTDSSIRIRESVEESTDYSTTHFMMAWGGTSLIMIGADGGILVHGHAPAGDHEVVEALREFSRGMREDHARIQQVIQDDKDNRP